MSRQFLLFLSLINAFVQHMASMQLPITSRRRVVISSFFFLSSYAAIPKPSSAACLQGDTSIDCIGFYKVPLDDAILPFIQTPEKLAEFAPGIRWVPPIDYPPTYEAARTELISLKARVAALDDMVLKGNLTEAGVHLLGILPRVTVSGRVLVAGLEGSLGKKRPEGTDIDLRKLRIENGVLELSSKLNTVDVLIGQALRGDLGSLTAGQIQILAELQEANSLYDEVLRAIPLDPKVR